MLTRRWRLRSVRSDRRRSGCSVWCCLRPAAEQPGSSAVAERGRNDPRPSRVRPTTSQARARRPGGPTHAEAREHERSAELADPRIVDFPLRGEWVAVHTPGSRIPSHGTDMLGQATVDLGPLLTRMPRRLIGLDEGHGATCGPDGTDDGRWRSTALGRRTSRARTPRFGRDPCRISRRPLAARWLRELRRAPGRCCPTFRHADPVWRLTPVPPGTVVSEIEDLRSSVSAPLARRDPPH